MITWSRVSSAIASKNEQASSTDLADCPPLSSRVVGAAAKKRRNQIKEDELLTNQPRDRMTLLMAPSRV